MVKESLLATCRVLEKGIGLLDLGDAPGEKYQRTLSHVIIEAMGSHPDVIVMNFKDLNRINSINMALLVGWIVRIKPKINRLLVVGLNHALFEAFCLIGLDQVVEICANEQDTWASLGIPAPAQVKSPRKKPVKDETTGTWTSPVSQLRVHGLPANAIRLNVEGRIPTGPLDGFGRLFRKTYQVVLPQASASPRQIVQMWKKEFPKFWPKGNYYYGPSDEITPGQVSILHLAGAGGYNYPGKLPFIATGILVIYSDEESFAFLSVEGHTIAGMITFAAYKETDGSTVIQMKVLGRASDPLYELIFLLGVGHAMEDAFWIKSLKNLLACLGATGRPESRIEYLDQKFQWSRANNLWKNAAVSSFFYMLAAPFRWLGNLVNVKG